MRPRSNCLMTESLLNGTLHECELDEWTVRWEADQHYRHWCSLTKKTAFNGKFIAVCLFNPGSLSGDGSKIRRDTTLRILREVFTDTAYGCLVLNLFDRATPKPQELFLHWSERDKANAPPIYPLVSQHVAATTLGYGAYELHRDPMIANEIRARIAQLNAWRANFHEIENPTFEDRIPKHVMRWQIEGLKDIMAKRFAEFSE